jgi:integrase/recombinase XerC
MRQVIRRFLKHLEAEKNASETTIESYQYDLHKFDAYLVKRLGNKFLPGDVPRDHIRDYLMWLAEVGHQKPNGPSARARALAAIRSFFKYAHRAGLLRDNPAADIALPKIRMGEIRALSQDELWPTSASYRNESESISKTQGQGHSCDFPLNGREAARNCTAG